LLDFFFYREQRDHDNIIAGDFVEDWGTRRRLECKYLHAKFAMLNKALAHLALKRIRYGPTDKKWDVAAVRSEIGRLIDEFKAKLAGPRKPWFDEPA
jgi:hypothetical protein